MRNKTNKNYKVSWTFSQKSECVGFYLSGLNSPTYSVKLMIQKEFEQSRYSKDVEFIEGIVTFE